ncbi:MAG: N-acetyltransferase [Bacteroidales bacterium]|nr:N-acetyltransferase [Bacteroidales bacterium]
MKSNFMKIRKALDSDLEDILRVERAAFNSDEEAELVRQLIVDESAKPLLSLLAFKKDFAVGHILFTKVFLQNNEVDVSCMILAPLAVIPEFQKSGIGSKLINTGLKILSESGTDLVFVLGYPEYYTRYGFKSATCLGFEAPYSIPAEHEEAWMVISLRSEVIGLISGKVVCANALYKPEYWRE